MTMTGRRMIAITTLSSILFTSLDCGPTAGPTSGGANGNNGGATGSGASVLDPSLFQGSPASLPAGSGASELVNIEDVPQGLVSYIDLDGQNYFLIFGERDEEGSIAKYTAAMLLNSATGAAYQYIFDGERRPIQIIDKGTVIDISYDEVAETFTLTRDGQSVTAPIPESFKSLDQAVFDGVLKRSPGERTVSVSAIIGGVLAPVGMVAALIIGTYTSPVWATLTIVGATATAITSAYHAAYTANNQPPPPDLAQAMNVIDAIGTLTSIADLGKNALTLVSATAKSTRVAAVISVASDVQGLAEPVSQGVKIAISAVTQDGVSAALVNHDLSYGPDYASIWFRAPGAASQTVMTYLERTGQWGEYLSVDTDSVGRGRRIFIRPAPGGTATLTLYVGDTPVSLTFSF